MTAKKLFFALIVGLVGTSIPGYGAEQEIVGSFSWGEQANQVKLVEKEEVERIGPVSFTIADGDTFLLDTAGKRVVSFSKESKNVSKEFANTYGSSFCIDNKGTVYTVSNGAIYQTGSGDKSLTKMIDLTELLGDSTTLAEGYGIGLEIDNSGQLVYRTLDQKTIPICAVQKATENVTPSPCVRYMMKRLGGDDVRLLGFDAKDKVLLSAQVNVSQGVPGAALFKGTDSQGNYYVEVEAITAEECGLEVHKFSPQGKALGVLKLNNKYHTTVYKKTEVQPDGSVYQMLTTPKGVTISRWVF